MPTQVGVWLAQAFSGWVAAAGGSSGAILGATYTGLVVGYTAAVVAISYGLSSISNSLMGRPRGSTSYAGRSATVKLPTARRAIIYGEVTCGGVLVWMNTTGTKNEFLDFLVAIAGHQVEAITDVYFDDVKISNADINGGAAAGGAVGGSGDFRPRDGRTVAYIYKYLGTDAQTASSQMTAGDGTGYPSNWTSSHRGRGVAYVHIRLRRSASAYPNGAPGNFRFHVKGARLYDPRKDSTQPGGSGSHRLNNATTWEYSNNTALAAADYIAGGTIVNDVATPVRRRGFAVANPATAINWPAIMAAANIADEDVTIPP